MPDDPTTTTPPPGGQPQALTDEEIDAIRQRAETATPGPWGWNSYALVCSVPLMQAEDDAPDYPEERRPGPPFFTEADNAWLAQRHAAYEADSVVAWVPAEYGDTATGRHAADAEFIVYARTDVPALLAALAEARARSAHFEALAKDQQATNAAMVASLQRGLAELKASEAEVARLRGV